MRSINEQCVRQLNGEVDESEIQNICGGIEMAAKKALQNSGKFIPWQVVTISTDGRILE